MHKQKVKIVIAEDHTLVRHGYIRILNECENYEVIGEASNGKELLELLKNTRPDIILLDLEMPVMKGGEAFEVYKNIYPSIKTIILSMHFDDSYVSEYFLKGVNGYLPKSCDPDQLFEAIDSVMIENYFFSQSASRILLSKILNEKNQKSEIEKFELNELELSILKLLCEEKTSKQIAECIGISAYSVDHNRRSIQAKTQRNTSIGLFKFAVKHGIASIE